MCVSEEREESERFERPPKTTRPVVFGKGEARLGLAAKFRTRAYKHLGVERKIVNLSLVPFG